MGEPAQKQLLLQLPFPERMQNQIKTHALSPKVQWGVQSAVRPRAARQAAASPLMAPQPPGVRGCQATPAIGIDEGYLSAVVCCNTPQKRAAPEKRAERPAATHTCFRDYLLRRPGGSAGSSAKVQHCSGLVVRQAHAQLSKDAAGCSKAAREAAQCVRHGLQAWMS